MCTGHRMISDVTALRSPKSRMLAAGGAAIVAAVAGVALLLQNTSAACAAPPTGSAVRTGKATFYDLGGGQGNCSFPGAPVNDLFVALGAADYSAGAACGAYLDVTWEIVRAKRADSSSSWPNSLMVSIPVTASAKRELASPTRPTKSAAWKRA